MNLKVACLAMSSMLVLSGLSFAEDAGTTTNSTGATAPETTVTDPVPATDPVTSSEDTAESSSQHSGPGTVVSAQAKTLKDVDGSKKDAAKTLRTTALTNNPGFQTATTKRNSNANQDDETQSSGKSGEHPTSEDHPDKEDHPDSVDNPENEDHASADDHPDADDNPGDLASEEHGPPDDLPGAEDHPDASDHPGRPGGG